MHKTMRVAELRKLISESLDNDSARLDQHLTSMQSILTSLLEDVLPVAKQGDLSLGDYGTLDKMHSITNGLSRVLTRIRNADRRNIK